MNTKTSISQRSRRRKASPSERINLRVDAKLKATLVSAARLRQVNLTEFVLRASQVAAEIELADRRHFALSPEQWREFNAALDAPPRVIPELLELFKKPSVFGGS